VLIFQTLNAILNVLRGADKPSTTGKQGMIVRSIHTCLNATRNLLVHRHVWMLQPRNNVQVNVNNSKAQKSAALSVPLSVKRHMMMVRVMNPAKSTIISQSVTGNVLLNVRTVSRIR